MSRQNLCCSSWLISSAGQAPDQLNVAEEMSPDGDDYCYEHYIGDHKSRRPCLKDARFLKSLPRVYLPFSILLNSSGTLKSGLRSGT